MTNAEAQVKPDHQMKEMNQVLCRLLWVQLQSLGIFTEEKIELSSLHTKSGLLDGYVKWLAESIAVLTSHNYLRRDGDAWLVINSDSTEANTVWQEWEVNKKRWLENPATKAQTLLTEATLRALPEILIGKRLATDVMFPNSSMELVEEIYKNNQIADFFNEVLADILVVYLQERLQADPAAQIRIIEIGAGTGGSSSMIFKKLQPYRNSIQEYAYTDISKAFLLHAQKEYGPQNPYLTYKIFNVAASIAGQAIDANGYDIAIATNVLHATRNIRQTLRNTKAVLKKHGLLLLNEISGKSLFAHLTFGLLEGWWLYEDQELRIEGCPALAPQTWQAVLVKEGFQSVFFPVSEAHHWGQQIVVAESDGIVRQVQERKTNEVTVARQVNYPALQKPSVAPKTLTTPVAEVTLREKSVEYFKKVVGDILKIPSHKIDAAQPLEKYGIDSILVIQLTNALREVLDNVSSTLFFEYQTIGALVEHFIATQRTALIALVGLAKAGPDAAVSREAASLFETPPSSHKPALKRKRGWVKNHDSEIKQAGLAVSREQDIAIIGIAGRYPGAENLQTFWENLQAGKDCITEIPQERWDNRRYFDTTKNKPGKTHCNWGGFIEGVDQFDPLFFNISPREAEVMDPMVRLFLETVWNIFESVGYTRESLQQRYQSQVGVYVGAMYQQYQALVSDIVRESTVSITSYSSIANRVSHYFDFQGPSLALDTMCSSAALAIHMACESLRRGDCRLAIAGGVNLSIHPKKYLGLSFSGMLGSHPNSRSFSDGDGYLPAEAVGAVLLKPLAQAVKDQDIILAVIKGTTTNHGGHTHGATVPNPKAQAQLIEDNLLKSGIDPRTISYVEAAANGSALGDAIEITALNNAFQKYSSERNFCAIGSVKSNIGHAEAASGITQLTKVILQIQHRQLVPTIKADPLNPHINFENTPFYLQQEYREWQPRVKQNGIEQALPRRAMINSFGAGGSNVNLIVEEYLPVAEETVSLRNENTPQLLVFSAKNRERLQAVVEQMRGFIAEQPELSIADLAYTLQVGREAMESRVALIVSTREELCQGLAECVALFKANQESENTPIYRGELAEDRPEIRNLLSGKVGETLVQMLLAEQNLEKLAFHWTQGGSIPWETLHEGEQVQRIVLPTYPFEKRRCWVGSPTEVEPGLVAPVPPENGNALNDSPAALRQQIVDIFIQLIGILPTDVELNKPIAGYGFDSIILMQLLQQLQSQVDPNVDLIKLQECKTIREVIEMVQSINSNRPRVSNQAITNARITVWPQFPELIRLGPNFQGRPVFWIHAGFGEVEPYRGLAAKIKRPFYGIQARGRMTNRLPLNGPQAAAAYYVHIIQSVQAEGPYDLGGYSFGGALAYEVARQLQEMGQVVKTIVMVDSLDGQTMKKLEESIAIPEKAIILQTVNTALLSATRKSKKGRPKLIHRDEINFDVDLETLLRQLIGIAKTRGLTKTESQIYDLFQKNIDVRKAFKGEFPVLPLTDSQTVTCYYFRNQSRKFYGETEPYFSDVANSETAAIIEASNYWEEWQRQFTHFELIDVDSESHMVMLSELKPREAIIAFCEKLYAEMLEYSGIS